MGVLICLLTPSITACTASSIRLHKPTKGLQHAICKNLQPASKTWLEVILSATADPPDASCLHEICCSHTKDSRHSGCQWNQAHQFQKGDSNFQRALQRSEIPTPDSSWHQHYPEMPVCQTWTRTRGWGHPPEAPADCETPRLGCAAELAESLSLECRGCLCRT